MAQPREAASTSDNAYDLYVQAAGQIEASAKKYLDRVTFTPGQRDAVGKLSEAPLAVLAKASKLKSQFRFTPVSPDRAPENQRGWRLLGRALAWRIESAVSRKDFDPAISDLAVATKFGFDLCDGGATDIALGAATVDEARRAFLPALADLSAKQCNSLSSQLGAAVAGHDGLRTAAANERLQMLEDVQLVQDAYRADDFAALRRLLGNDGRDAVDTLQVMKQDDLRKRPKYFAGLAAEAETDAAYQLEAATKPTTLRGPEPTTDPRRPWRTFAKHFFHSMIPAMNEFDATLARTRLLVLEANIRRDMKTAGTPPADLSHFSADVSRDPYSGKPFVYAVSKDRFLLYSVGSNGIDDGGNTDETFSSPDLTLERR